MEVEKIMDYTVIFKENSPALIMMFLSAFILITWVMVGFPDLTLDSVNVFSVATVYLLFLIFTFVGYIIKYLAPDAPGGIIDLGDPDKAWINISLGIVAGLFVALTLLAGAVAKATLMPFTVTLPLQFLFICLISPFVEELFFRGWLLPTLSQYLSGPAGTILVSIAFALYHVNTWGAVGLMGYLIPFTFSLLLSLLVLKLESVAPAIIAHTTANTIITLTQLTAPTAKIVQILGVLLP